MDLPPLLTDLAPSATFQLITFPVAEGWGRLNPSIARANDGFLSVVRSSNVHIEDGRYVTASGGFPFRSENYLAVFDDDLQLHSIDKLRDETSNLTKHRSRFPGYTDLRLFPGPAGWQATAATHEHNPRDLNQQVLLQVQNNQIREPVLLSSPEAGHQKNWMPVLGVALPTLVTYCSPTTVVMFDLAREFAETIAEYLAPPIAKTFRGGSQLVPAAEGYVCVIHERLRWPTVHKLYAHRVVHFTTDFHIDAVSRQFVFQLRGVEFCAGLALHDGRFVISYGENDGEAYLAAVAEKELLDLLHPVGAIETAPLQPSRNWQDRRTIAEQIE